MNRISLPEAYANTTPEELLAGCNVFFSMNRPAEDLERIDNLLQQVTVIANSNPSFLPEHRRHIDVAMGELIKAVFYPRPPDNHWNPDLYIEQAEALLQATRNGSVNMSPPGWNVDDRPWFITFNPYYGPDAPLTFYWFDPFPEERFVANSPYDEHVVIAHHGIERVAEAAGQRSVEDYIKGLIVSAVTRQLETNAEKKI